MIREFDIKKIEIKRLEMLLDIKDVCNKAHASYEAWKTFVKYKGSRSKTRTVIKLLKALELPVESVIMFKDTPPNEPQARRGGE